MSVRPTQEEAHRIARDRGIVPWAYRLFELFFLTLLRAWVGLRVEGVENVPLTGPAVVAPNHKSFFDSFVVAAALPRRSYALETARLLLRRGELVTVFPEGTRVAGADVLGTPKRGAARLAIETRSPVVPVAISGMEKRQLPLPRRVTVAFGAPVDVTGLEATPEGAGQLIAETVWPRVEEDYRRLLARPGVVATSLAAVAVAFAVVRHRRRS